MSGRTKADYLIELYLAGHDSFTSSQPWLKGVTGEGKLFCPQCHNIYESVKGVDAVVANKQRRTDMDLIAVNCGGVQLLSTHFLDVVGPALVEKTAWLGRLNDAAGFEHERYRTAVCKSNAVVVRGIHGTRPACVKYVDDYFVGHLGSGEDLPQAVSGS